MMGRFPSSEKIMPPQNPVPSNNHTVDPPFAARENSLQTNSSQSPIWLTGFGVFGVMVLMGTLGLGLALWTQSERRARDLPKVFALQDKLVESVAAGADLVFWAKGNFPVGNPGLMDLLPERIPAATPGEDRSDSKAVATEMSGCRFLEIPQALGLGKTREWVLSRKFGEKLPNVGGWVRLALQLESANGVQKQTDNPEILLPGPGAPGIRLVQKEGFLEWKQTGARFQASMGAPIFNNPRTSPIANDYGGTLAPDFLELRLGRIPPETPAWVMARGEAASKLAASVLLGRFPDWTPKGFQFPKDSGVLGLWEEAGNLRVEWIFTEPSHSDDWEKEISKAQLGPQWKWIKQGRVISLQRKEARLWSSQVP